jgi:hypothetical protein
MSMPPCTPVPLRSKLAKKAYLNHRRPLFLTEEGTIPLTAKISSYTDVGDSRAAGRHTLRLEVAAATGQVPASAGADRALIYNLSTNGLLLETAVALSAGDMLVVSLPEVGPVPAEVIWARDGFAGCKFERSVPVMAVSAARLRAEPAEQPHFAVREPAQATWGYDTQHETQDGTLVRAIMLGSLVIAFVTAAIFVVALLSFPFSAQ